MEALTRCPMCGSKKIRRESRTIKGTWHGQPYRAPNVVVEACPVCGEVFFDHDAMQKIEEKAMNITSEAKTKNETKGAMVTVEASGINTIKGSLVKIN